MRFRCQEESVPVTWVVGAGGSALAVGMSAGVGTWAVVVVAGG